MSVTWSDLEAPVRVGEAIELCPPKFGKVMTVQRYRFPDNHEDNFVLFGNPSKVKPPSIVLPMTREGNVVLIRQFRYGAGGFVVEIPGGNPKPGESAEEVLRKELLEETGYEVRGMITRLGEGIWFDPASVPTPFIPFLASDCARIQEPSPERTEIMESREVPFEEFMAMAKRGEINDSKTLAIALLAIAYLETPIRLDLTNC